MIRDTHQILLAIALPFFTAGLLISALQSLH